MKTNIREYVEELPIEIKEITEIECGGRGEGRVAIYAEDEGGYNGAIIDLLDVIEWVKQNKPELLKGE